MWRYVWNLRRVRMPASTSLASHTLLNIPLHPPLSILYVIAACVNQASSLASASEPKPAHGRSGLAPVFSWMTTHISCLWTPFFLPFLLHAGGSRLWLILCHTPLTVEVKKRRPEFFCLTCGLAAFGQKSWWKGRWIVCLGLFAG